MRWSGWLIAVAVVASLCWLFPLFHIVPLQRAAKEKAVATFDPKAFAKNSGASNCSRHSTKR